MQLSCLALFCEECYVNVIHDNRVLGVLKYPSTIDMNSIAFMMSILIIKVALALHLDISEAKTQNLIKQAWFVRVLYSSTMVPLAESYTYKGTSGSLHRGSFYP